MSNHKLVTARILAEAQHAANEVDHEDHDEAVVVALEVAAPLIAAKALEVDAKQDRVIGCIHWDKQHTSPWMTFDNISAFRQWTTAVRKAGPGAKTEYAYIDLCWTADSMLSHLQREAEENSK